MRTRTNHSPPFAPLLVVPSERIATAQKDFARLHILDAIGWHIVFRENLFVMLPLKGRNAGQRKRRSAEVPRIARHTSRAARPVVNVDNRPPFLDPFRFGELGHGSDHATGKAGFADLSCQSLQSAQRQQPTPPPFHPPPPCPPPNTLLAST